MGDALQPVVSAAAGLIVTGLLACIAFGFAFQVSRMFHLALGANVLVALYFGLVLARAGSDLVEVVLLVVSAGACFGAGVELLVYRALIRLGVPNSRMVIASLGVLVVCQSLIAWSFGTELKTIETSPASGELLVLHLAIIAMTVVAAATLPSSWDHKVLMAVGENPGLAATLGISTERARLIAFALSGAAAGLLAVVLLFSVGARPEYGLQYVLVGSVGTLVGGSRSFIGWILGGAALGGVRLAALNALPNSGYVDLVTFLILLGLLLFRSNQLFGSIDDRRDA